MKQKRQQTLRSLALAFFMLLMLQPATHAMINNVFESITLPNYIGESGITWEIKTDGTLLIGGSGTAPIFNSPADQPWADVRDQITSVVYASMSDIFIPNMQYWFAGCTQLQRAEIPYTARVIGIDAFDICYNLTELFIYYMDEDVFEIIVGAFYSPTIVDTKVYLISQETRIAAILKEHGWGADNRSPEFRDIYSYETLTPPASKAVYDTSICQYAFYCTCQDAAEREFWCSANSGSSTPCYHNHQCRGCGGADYTYHHLSIGTEIVSRGEIGHSVACEHPQCINTTMDIPAEDHVFDTDGICTICGYRSGSGSGSTGGDDDNDTYYQIRWDAGTNGGTINGKTSITDIAQEGVYLELPKNEPVKSGYVFVGWFTEATGGTQVTSSTLPTDNHRFFAQFMVIPAKITWNSNGGIPEEIVTEQEIGTSVIFPEEEPTRTGYTFNGWYTLSDGGTEVTSTTTVSQDVVYYAHWSLNQSTLTVDPNGGSWGGSTTAQSFTQDYNTTKTIVNATPINFTAAFNANGGSCGTTSLTTNKAFAGWALSDPFVVGSLSGTTFTFGPEKNGTGTLTATWSGTYQITLPEASREGYTFTGWFTAATGGTYVGKAGTVVTLSTNVTYHAQWTAHTSTLTINPNGGFWKGSPDIVTTPAQPYGTTTQIDDPTTPKYTATFNANGGSCTSQTITTDKAFAGWAQSDPFTAGTLSGKNFTYGPVKNGSGILTATWTGFHSIKLPTPTREGYTFKGWYTAEGGSSAVVAAGETVTLVADVTYYAKWEINYYTVIWDTNGGTINGASSATTSVPWNTYATSPGSPEKQGYTFAGWYTDPVSGTSYADTKVKTNTTFYAHWTTSSYTITWNANGGAPDQYTTQSYGVNLVLPTTNPTKAGQSFVGWFTEPNGGTQVTSETPATGQTTYYAHWATSIYTITWDSQGGSSIAPTTQAHGSRLELPATPIKTGQGFVGWFTAKTGGTQVTESAIVTEPATYYAHWTDVNYTITWDANGGLPETQSTSQPYGAKIIFPATSPTRVGYIFAGWFTARSGGSQVTSETTVGGAVTYYAHWTPANYTITWNSQGGSSVGSTNQAYGSNLSLPNTPTKEGHGFVGWFTDPTGGTQVTPDTTVTGDATYYAHWSTNSYTITWNTQGGSSVGNTYQDYGSHLILPAPPTKAGQVFEGWFTAASGGVQVTTATLVTGNATYYAHWSTNSYMITWDSQGGSAVDATSQTYGSNLKLPDNPSKAGQGFVGWFTDPTGGTQVTPDTTVTGDATYYAHWSTNSYTITWNSQGGSAVASTSQAYGSSLILPAAPTKTGQTFDGWFDTPTGGTQVTAAIVVTGDATYYARWSTASYTVTWDANGGTPATQYTTQAYGAKVVMPTTNPSQLGRTFLGWYTTPTGGTQVTAETTYQNSGATTYYAHWSAANSYTITWNANGGTPATQTTSQVYGDKTVLPTTNPTKAGHTFIGWFTEANGGTQITSETTHQIAGATTYYAHWSTDAPSIYTIKWDSQGGSAISNTSQAHGTNLSLPATPSRTGYTFVGWFTDASGGTQVGSFTLVTGNVTYYAHWTINQSTLTVDPNGGTWGGLTSPQSFTRDYNTTKTIGNATISNFTVTFNANGGACDTTTSTTNMAFTGWAQESPFTAGSLSGTTFTFGPGKNGAGTLKASWSGSYAITLPNATRTGYTFAGWFTAATGGSKIGDAGTKVTLSATTTYYAQWVPNRCTIKWDSQGGSIVKNTSQNYDTNLVLPTPPTRTGYSFVGWFTAVSGGVQIDTSTIVTGSITYYAHWSINSSTLTVDPNGGTWDGWTAPKSFKQNYNTTKAIGPATISNYTVTFNPNGGSCSTSTAKTNMAFAGWAAGTPFTAGSLSGTTFTFGPTKDGAGTLTARWSGSYQIVLPAATRTGYTFAGWFTAPTGGAKVGDPGDTITLGSTTTYYGQWAPIQYTITWKAAGGAPANQTTTVTYGGTIAFPTEPTRAGYTFLGWFGIVGSVAQENGRDLFGVAGDTSSQVFAGTTYQTPSNTTYYARWKNDNYCQITTHPSGSTTTYPAAPSMAGAAQGLTGLSTILYQWQMSRDNATWSDIGGATGSSYTVPAGTTAGVYYYRFVATSEFNGSIKTAISNSTKVEILKATDELYVIGMGGTPISDNSQVIFALEDPALDWAKVTCLTNSEITVTSSNPSIVHANQKADGTLTLTPLEVSYDIPVIITIQTAGNENYNPISMTIRAYVSDGPYITATYTPDSLTSLDVTAVIRVTDVMQYLDGAHRVASVAVKDPSKVLTQISGPSIRYGDTNGDGLINVTDAQYVTNFLSGAITENVIDLMAADVDGDGKVSGHDADLILQKVTGSLSDFPVSYASYYEYVFYEDGTDVFSAKDTRGSTRNYIFTVDWIDRVPPSLQAFPVEVNPSNSQIVTYVNATDNKSQIGSIQICWDFDPNSNSNAWTTTYLADLTPGKTVLIAAKDEAGNITVISHFVKWNSNESADLIEDIELSIENYKLGKHAYMDAAGILRSYSLHPVTGEYCIPVEVLLTPAQGGYLAGYAQLNSGVKYPLYWGIDNSSNEAGKAIFYITASSLTTSQRNATVTVYVVEYKDETLTKKTFSDVLYSTIMVDITPPVTSISLDRETGIVTITTRDDLIGLATVQYATETETGAISAYNDYTGAFQLPSGVKYVHVKATDKLRNEGVTSSVNLSLDNGNDEVPGGNEEYIESGGRVYRTSVFYYYIIGAN